MKGMKKLFALLAVLTMALTLTPMVTPVAAALPAPQPTIAITLGTPKWMTEKDAGLSTSTTMVLQVPGTISGTVADNLVNADITYNGDGIPSILIPQGYNFTLYFKYADLASFGEDGVLEVAYEGKSDSVPVNLFKITTKDAVSEEVTSGQKVTITGTVAPVQKGAEVNLTNYKVYAWRDEEDLISSATVSTTGTFSLVFYAYGNLETEYEITVQPKDPEDYNGAPYYSVVVSKLAEVKVNPIPDTIVAGSDNVVEFQLFVGTTTLAKHSVTGTITLGSETKTFTATTDDEGKATATGVNFSSIGVADVTVKVSGPNYYGTGTGKLAVSASEEYGLSVKWPTTWEIGEENEVQFITPMAGYTFVSVKVKVSGPVVESGEQLKGTSTVGVTPKGYGTLTLNVEAVLKKDSATTAITKSFSTTIPGYLATADPEELVRGATQTLTVVVKDAYGNPVNNALVQFFSPVNSDDPIAKLDGTATTVVNNGTYKLTIVGSAIKKADEDAYVEVRDSKGRQAYIPVAIAKSPDIKLVVDKEEIVLGPKTTITVTISSPVALAGTVLSIVDEEGEDTELISYMLSGSATVQTITLPVNKMPKEAGVYQLLAESANYVGTATLTFVEPVITASPAELLAGATTVVTFTSANVKDLTTVTKVTATGAISKITAKTATDAITATVVTANVKGTGTVTFEFNSGYKFDLPISVVYGKLSVDNATVAFGTKVLTFKPVDAAGATLAVGTPVKINLLGNEYSGYVAEGGSVSVLIPELPMGTYSVLVKVAGYQDATFSLVVAEAEPEFKTVIELAPGMDIYTVNGETKFWDATPYIKEGRTLVPIRHLAEAVGFKASWDFSDPANKMVFIFKADQDPEKDKEHPFILLIIGQPTAMVNGNLVALDVAPEILNGRTMVPLRFVVETLGYKVEWLGNTIRLMK